MWFESLATALNKEMALGSPAAKYTELLQFISAAYQTGDEQLRSCIDAAFAENLFRQVDGEKSGPYWQVVPDDLKQLYAAFYGRVPL